MSDGQRDPVEPEPRVRARQERIWQRMRMDTPSPATEMGTKVRQYFPFLEVIRR